MNRLAILLSLFVLLPGVATADRAATEKQGFNSKGSFQIGGIDAVSLFQGSLVVTLPIGPTYPVSPALSYGLSLVYSSTAGWEHVTCPEGTFMPEPDPRNTGGFGWRVSLGYVVFAGTHWVYESPDGGRHGLYPRLHPDYPATPQSNVYYSNDSTNMRMRYFASSSLCESPVGATNECVLVQFPGGLVHEFRKVQASDDVYRVTRMRDPFGHFVAVFYGGTTCQITDSEGRTQTLEFAGPATEYKRVRTATLTGFNGTQSVFTFQYENRVIERRDFDPAGCSLDNDKLVTVQVLTRLVLPDNSYYDFDYYTLNSAPEFLPGGLKSLRHPTGGEYRWAYEKQSYQSQDPGGDRFDRDVTTVYPVTRKEIALSVGGPAIGTWLYDYRRSADMAPGDTLVRCHRATVVTDPEGNDTVHYFSTSNASHLWSYGLPFTRCAPGEGYSAIGPFLSSEVYEGSVDTGTKLRSFYVEYSSDGRAMGNGEVNQEKNHRLIYRKIVYHDDGDRFKETTFSDYDGVGNFRDQTEAGNFSAQDARTVTTDYNSSLGTLVVDPETGDTTGSTFVLPALSDPWLFTTYTKRQVTAAGATATTEACFDSNTGFLERMRVLAGTSRAAKDLLTVLEPEVIGGHETGRVASEKLYGGDDQTSMDNVYSSLCTMTLPLTPKYQTDHTYSAGVLATSTAIDPCDGSAALSLLDQTIDANTGLVAASRDPAGVETVYGYDARNRLISVRPDESAWISYDFQLPTQASPGLQPQLKVQACPNGSTTCIAAAALTWQRFDYDGLGRQVTERIRIPEVTGIVEKARTTTYNALGWKLSESVWGNAALVTSFSGHDPFGRVGTITPPGQPATEFTYEGERTKTRKVRVTLPGGMSDAYTTEIHDARGRLISVCENQSQEWAGTCTGIETGYLYDVNDHLVRVCSDKNGSACGQIRRFVYDNRGFLIQERHPEIGVLESAAATSEPAEIIDSDGFVELEAADAGNDWTFYTRDARGNVLTKDVEGSTEFDLIYHYDAVGRLIRLEETNGGSPRPLKELFYGYENDGTDLRRGKLYQAKRHNWVDVLPPLLQANPGALDAVVTETFKHEGHDGRVSARQTRFSFNGATYAFNLSQTYDQLGNVASLTYPQCVHSQGDCPSAAPSRTVTYTYTKGFLTAVPGYATKISYQAGGMLHQIEHANGVTYTMEINPADGLERPYRISTTAGWNTGTYHYDGAGNVTEIGQQSYRYDRLNRLVSGQVQVGASLRTQTVSYDDFGNITSLTTNGILQSTATDASTNRLQSPLGQYDGGGNVTELDFGSERYAYTYDGVNMMKQLRSDTDLARIFLYTADDERIAQFDCSAGVCATQSPTETWTIRDLNGRLLRMYSHPSNQGWNWEHDYILRSGQPLATVDGAGTQHLHVDHLGSVRQVTNGFGTQVDLHSYYPFGQEATITNQDNLSLKFTGHERDPNSSRGVLDYMHARYCSPVIGRFLGVDPVYTGRSSKSQSWNKYSYVVNSPMLRIDPDGRGDLLSIRAHGDVDKLMELVEKEGGTPLGAFIGFSILYGGSAVAANLPRLYNFLVSPEVVSSTTAIAGALIDQPTPAASALGKTLGSITEGGDDLLDFTINTSKGNVGVLAEIQTEGKTLIAKDLTVFEESGKILTGLTKDIKKAADQLKAAARQQGFTKLIIRGIRLDTSTSANPGKVVEIVINLVKEEE